MKFKTWKTIKLGTGPQTFADFCKKLETEKCFFVNGIARVNDDEPLDLILHPQSGEVEVALVNVSIAELGLCDPENRRGGRQSEAYPEIRDRAERFGLGICSLETALQLCLGYQDEPNTTSEILNVAIEQFNVSREKCLDPDHHIFILGLYHDAEGRKICPVGADSLQQFHHTDRFVFLQSR